MRTPTAPRPKRQPTAGAKLTRERLIEAAFAVLDEQNTIEAVSLRAVARAAGVTAPALYGHFTDVTELHAAMRDRTFQDLIEQTDAVAEAAANSLERLLARCQAYVALGIKWPARRRLMFTPLEGASRRAGYDALDALVVALEACVAEGFSTSTDPRADAANLLAALHGVSLTRISMTEFPWPPLGQSVTTVTRRLACIDTMIR
ncbi:TetR/AcrR family transcriptional regulator [Actinacidiphila soli]|uniref:TetR/AcrR family transcriptional regulator n=1 Tax=Actinacidiphila soli TaxID=2487275 RepID=UPI000FCB06A5|nr:TetR/AcrR family transcriptional regulator [Actinacidiphila soli]